MRKSILIICIVIIIIIVAALFVQAVRISFMRPEDREFDIDFRSIEYESVGNIRIPQVPMNDYFSSGLMNLRGGYLLLYSRDENKAVLDFIKHENDLSMKSKRLLYDKDSIWPRKKSLWPISTFNNDIGNMKISHETGYRIKITFETGAPYWLVGLFFAIGVIILITGIITIAVITSLRRHN